MNFEKIEIFKMLFLDKMRIFAPVCGQKLRPFGKYLENLSLMAFGLSVQMQIPVTVHTQVPTIITEDNGQSLAIIVIIAGGPGGRGLIVLPRGQTVYMLFVQNT